MGTLIELDKWLERKASVSTTNLDNQTYKSGVSLFLNEMLIKAIGYWVAYRSSKGIKRVIGLPLLSLKYYQRFTYEGFDELVMIFTIYIPNIVAIKMYIGTRRNARGAGKKYKTRSSK